MNSKVKESLRIASVLGEGFALGVALAAIAILLFSCEKSEPFDDPKRCVEFARVDEHTVNIYGKSGEDVVPRVVYSDTTESFTFCGDEAINYGDTFRDLNVARYHTYEGFVWKIDSLRIRFIRR